MRCMTYKCVLIFIIIKCVESQDNNPDQPSEEEEEYNFDVLDLDKIIQDRISRFDDPQYQHYDYYQPELQGHPPQPQTQPQQHPGYQPESQGYQPQTQPQPEYQYYQPEQYDFYQPETLQYQPESYGYEPEQFDQYQQEAYGYYEPPTTQPSQQPQQYYQSTTTQPYQQPSYPYYGPPVPPQPQPAQPSYPYYLPPPTQPTYQQQPQYQYYQPTTTQTPTQPEVTHSPQPQSETVEDDDDFYVTEHDQQIQEPVPVPETGHETTQQSIKPQKEPRKRATKRKDPRTPEKQDEEEPVKLKKPRQIKKSKKPKFYKRNYLGKLEEMTEEDYVVIFSDKKKKEYVFNTYLEQIEFDNELIYEHINGTSYCSLLSQTKETDVFILTNSDGFTLVKRIKGIWTTTDHVTPYYVKLFTQDDEGNEVLITSDQYIIDLNSFGSFTYKFHLGVKCYKIVVKEITAWEKTDEDDEIPVFINVSSELNVMVKFNKYTKMFERRTKHYKVKDNRLNFRKPK
ncbi:SVSP family protein [Theileria parva strain Muguga]|uniref:Theileria-specific sub-telomeric protein, SVSP family n=1 Tax=Theileria parva TaxID=5875 RepID=Q4MYG2_THEPA|nr:SVSP family protein [Theileria parva strain Muguga]EAN30720.1 SVSP family protein [Theileria parva strain Muguga]|eukprot:XP_763003.1 hypothetical protein [Theileria parva strain Muguga]